MSPKHKGDSEDWLDADTSQRAKGIKAKKKPAARARFLDETEANAVVAEVFPNQCKVILDDTQAEVACSYKRAAIFGSAEIRDRSPVAVGDRVLIKQGSPGSGVVEGLCERKTSLYRPAPGRGEGSLRQVIVANIETLVIVTSTCEPEFSPGIVDRYIVAAQFTGISPIICVNKIDLGPEEHPWEEYSKLGFPVYELSAKLGKGLEPLKKAILAKKAAFCGHSGVGKTSLLRLLLGSDLGQIGDLNPVTKKGRHTTTGACLFQGPDHSIWIDTPGVREFGLAVEAEQLKGFFKEFQTASCQAEDCLHLDESGCSVKEFFRYSSYRKILLTLLTDDQKSPSR